MLAGVVGGLEVAFTIGESGWIGGPGAGGWRIYAIQDFGLWVPLLDLSGNPTGLFSAEAVRLLSYSLIHASFTGTLFSVVLILAIGNILGRMVAWHHILLIFFTSSLVGAIGYSLFLSSGLLVGSSPAVFGMMGAFCLLIWTTPEVPERMRQLAGLMPLVLIGIQLMFWIAIGGPSYWLADISGFAGGILALALFFPGGGKRLAILLGKVRVLVRRR